MPKPVSEQVHGSCPGRVLRHSVFTRLIGRRPRPGEIATATLTRLRLARSTPGGTSRDR